MSQAGTIGVGGVGDLGMLLGGGSASGLDDAALLRRVAWGERGLADSAFAALVGRYGALVARVCGGVLGDHHAAEDAAQAVFLVLHDRAGAIRDPSRLAPWLHGVALRTARHARRRARRELPASPTDRTTTPDEATPMTDPADALIARERAEILHAVIRGLPLRYRTPLILCDLQGLTHAEAAAHLGCPLATLSSRLKRAKDQLRARLSRRHLDLGHLPLAGPVPAAVVGTLAGLARTGAARPSARALADRISWLAAVAPFKAFGAAAVLAGLLALGARGDGPAAPTPPIVPLAQDPPPAAVPAPPPTPDAAQAPAPPPAIPQDPPPEEAIRVGLPIRRAVPSFHEFRGRVAASRTVELRSPVQGTIQDQPTIPEGESVQQADVLFKVADTYSNSNEILMLTEEHRRAYSRYEAAKNKSTNSGDPAVTAALSKVNAIRNSLEKLRQRGNLADVKTPFDGVVAQKFVDAGATVEAGKTPLAVIAAVNPIRVDFTVGERSYNEVRRWLRKQADPTHLAVRVGLVDEEGFPHAGRVKFQAGQFEREAGRSDAVTILHAEVPNPERTLVPGQTARVVVEFGDPHPAILVPLASIVRELAPEVWRADTSGRAVLVRVPTGLWTADGFVEIPMTVGFDGLQRIEPTTRILIGGLKQVKQGMALPEPDKGGGDGDTPR